MYNTLFLIGIIGISFTTTVLCVQEFIHLSMKLRVYKSCDNACFSTFWGVSIFKTMINNYQLCLSECIGSDCHSGPICRAQQDNNIFFLYKIENLLELHISTGWCFSFGVIRLKSRNAAFLFEKCINTSFSKSASITRKSPPGWHRIEYANKIIGCFSSSLSNCVFHSLVMT